MHNSYFVFFVILGLLEFLYFRVSFFSFSYRNVVCSFFYYSFPYRHFGLKYEMHFARPSEMHSARPSVQRPSVHGLNTEQPENQTIGLWGPAVKMLNNREFLDSRHYLLVCFIANHRARVPYLRFESVPGHGMQKIKG